MKFNISSTLICFLALVFSSCLPCPVRDQKNPDYVVIPFILENRRIIIEANIIRSGEIISACLPARYWQQKPMDE
jgi:hypothetical protein